MKFLLFLKIIKRGIKIEKNMKNLWSEKENL
jgi:hypothetical protein